jgi:integrase
MRTPPHPLEEALRARVRLLATTLRPATAKQYEHTLRRFMGYLRRSFPDVRRASQLRRDPHIFGWLEYLWTWRIGHSGEPLSATSRAAHLIRMRKLFDLLADHAYPPPPGLLLSEDIPHPDQVLPRPLSPEDDARLQSELLRRNDLLSSALLLTRLTGMRIGETVDLSADCLRHLGGDQWALHVPVGKLHNERWTPVEERVRTLIARLQFLRTVPPRRTVQLPHSPPSHAFLAPVRSRSSRMTSISDRRGSTRTSRSTPLTVSLIACGWVRVTTLTPAPPDSTLRPRTRASRSAR